MLGNRKYKRAKEKKTDVDIHHVPARVRQRLVVAALPAAATAAASPASASATAAASAASATAAAETPFPRAAAAMAA